MPNTIAGDMEQMNSTVPITRVGYGATDAWVDVLKFPGTQLPSGNGTYTFVVFGVLGDPDWLPHKKLSFLKCQVGLGTADGVGVFGAFTFSANIWGLPRGAGVPFCFILDATTDASGLNQTTRSLTLKARMDGYEQRKADPFAIPQTSPRFNVLHATIMVFDRGVLSGADSYFDDVPVNRLTSGWLGKSGGDWDDLGSTSPTLGSTGEDWLVFHSISYEPAGMYAEADWRPTHFHLVQEPTVGTDLDVLGYTQTSGRTPTGTGFHGSGPWGRGVQGGGAGLYLHHNWHHTGSFHLATNLEDDVGYRMYCRMLHPNTGTFQNFLTWVHRWRLFAVRLSALSYVQTFDRATMQTGDPTQLFFPWWDQLNKVTETREFSNSDWSSYVMLATTTRRAKTREAPGYHLDLFGDEDASMVTTMPPVKSDQNEGVPLLTVGRIPTFRPNANKAKLLLSLQRAAFPPSQSSHFIADDTNWLGFYFETDPENLAFPNQTRGAEVALTPDGEADATSLSTWPIDPTNNWSEAPSLPLEEMRTPTGYRITWPKFLLPRDLRTWEWRGISKTQRDTLQTFIEDEAETAIKYQGPHDTAFRIYVPVGPYQFSEVPGGKFDLQISGIELVYGTNITPRVLT